MCIIFKYVFHFHSSKWCVLFGIFEKTINKTNDFISQRLRNKIDGSHYIEFNDYKLNFKRERIIHQE